MPQDKNKQIVKQAEKLLRDFLKELENIKKQAAGILSQAYKIKKK